MTVTYRTRLAAALLAGVFSLGGLAACGGGSSSDGGSSSATSSKDDAKGGTMDADEMAESMVAALNAVEKGDCSKAADITDELNGVDLADTASLDDWHALDDALAEAAEKGPKELRADLKTLSEGFHGIVGTYERLGITDMSDLSSIMGDEKKMAELEKLGETFDEAELTAASDNIEAWIDERCPGLND